MTTSSTELRPRRISARLDVENKTRNDLLLDLWQGFSKKIFVRTESDEEQDVSYYIPVFYNAPWSDYCADVELGRALQVGLLEFATEEGETVPIDTDTLHVAEIDRRIHLCEAYVGRCYPLARTSSNLLGRLRRSLNPEKTYLLRFGTNPLKIWWEFATSESIHKPLLSPSQWSADQWPKDKQITMAYDPMPIWFSVITGISIPRFTIEFSISASVCDVDEYRQFFATLKVASLEDKPVIIHRWLDNFMDLWQDERGSRGNEMDCLDVFDLCDETSLDSTTLPGDTPRPDINDPIRPEDICLHKGDTYTRNVYFDQGDLARLIPERTYSMTMRPQGLAAWSYGHEEKRQVDEFQAQSEPRERGPIMFEVVSAVASTIKAIFERELPKPFAILPFELRYHIYEHLRYSERADTVRFTVR